MLIQWVIIYHFDTYSLADEENNGCFGCTTAELCQQSVHTDPVLGVSVFVLWPYIYGYHSFFFFSFLFIFLQQLVICCFSSLHFFHFLLFLLSAVILPKIMKCPKTSFFLPLIAFNSSNDPIGNWVVTDEAVREDRSRNLMFTLHENDRKMWLLRNISKTLDFLHPVLGLRYFPTCLEIINSFIT